MEEEVRDAVFGNVGTTVAFRVGPFDAETLETIFSPQFEATDLVNLGFAQIYLTLMIRGVGSPPFSATTLPPFDAPPERHVDSVIAASRATYGKARAEVEKVIDEWQKTDPVVPEPPKPKYGKAAAPKPAAHAEYRPPAPKPAPTPTAPAPAPVRAPAPKVEEEQPMPPPEVLRETLLPAVVQRPKPPVSASHTKPRPQPVQPPKPPLEGPTSLREALAKVQGTKPPVVVPAPVSLKSTPSNLKEALTKVAPESHKKPPAPKNELTPEVLRQMLDVDEPKDAH